MLRMPAVSGLTLRSPVSGTGIGERRSPVEIVATMGTYLTRTHAAEVSGLRAGPFGRWADGVTAMRADCVAFADHWQTHNEQVLRTAAAGNGHSPLWVVLGDSTAQGLGAPSPEDGYVGQALDALRRRTGLPWQVLNLSASGSLIRDVLHHQLPRLPVSADLVTCGIGINDVLYTGPGKLSSPGMSGMRGSDSGPAAEMSTSAVISPRDVPIRQRASLVSQRASVTATPKRIFRRSP